MKILVQIPDNKVLSFMEVINSIPYVKAKPITEVKVRLLSEMKDAINEMNLIKRGKRTARNAKDFLNDLQ